MVRVRRTQALQPRSLIGLGLLVGGLAGCGGPSTPALTPVSGKVQYHGQPLTTGLIVFTPDEARGNSGPLALGTIAPDGSFTLTSDGAPGAPPGPHRVTIAAVAAGPSGPRSLLPDRYRDPERSRLQCEVAPGKANLVQFRLE